MQPPYAKGSDKFRSCTRLETRVRGPGGEHDVRFDSAQARQAASRPAMAQMPATVYRIVCFCILAPWPTVRRCVGTVAAKIIELRLALPNLDLEERGIGVRMAPRAVAGHASLY
jgi:hypothetical protein